MIFLPLAGCSGIFGSGGGESEPASVHRLLVENHTPENHTVHLQLLDTGEVSYWRSVKVPVTNADGEIITGTKLAPGFPQPPGEYTLLARLDDKSNWRDIDYSTTSVPGDACFEIVVTVEDSTTLGFLSSIDEAVCDKRSAPSEN
jgi:hypothetical protein